MSLSALTFKLYWNISRRSAGGLSKKTVLVIDRSCVAVPLVLLSIAYVFDSGDLDNENGMLSSYKHVSLRHSHPLACAAIVFATRGTEHRAQRI